MKAFQGPDCLFWEQARSTDCCCGMENIAMMEKITMLLFYLPIIIFEAMLEASAKKREAHGSTEIE
jgi:hypothetical protein